MAKTEFRCTNKTDRGEICDRFLAEQVGAKLLVFCPKCKQMHELSIVDLVRHLALEIETQAAAASDQPRLLL